MWDAIAYVSSGFTLVAFIVAAIAWTYMASIRKVERQIKQAPENERARLIENAHEVFRIETGGLTPEQRFGLVLKQIHAKVERFRITAVVIVIIASLGAGVSALAIWKLTTNAQASPFSSSNTQTTPSDVKPSPHGNVDQSPARAPLHKGLTEQRSISYGNRDQPPAPAPVSTPSDRGDRVLLDVTEMIEGQSVEGGRLTGALQQKLVAGGFSVTLASEMGVNELTRFRNAWRQAQAGDARSGDALPFDIIVSGSVAVAAREPFQGLEIAFANGSLKAMEVRGRRALAAVDVAEVRGYGRTREQAMRAALANACDARAEALVKQMLK